jgi:hypothetical protein
VKVQKDNGDEIGSVSNVPRIHNNYERTKLINSYLLFEVNRFKSGV